MNYRTLGRTNYSVSEIGLGCWQLGGDFGEITENGANSVLDFANRHKINFFDTADVYGDGLSERRISKKFHENTSVIIATKVGRAAYLYPDTYSKDTLKRSLETSLENLKVDSIDLLQTHCIPGKILRYSKIFEWLDDFQNEGLIKHYGASVENIADGQFCLDNTEISTLQIIFNIFRQDAKLSLLPQAKEKDVGIIVRLPLASGLLTGNFNQGQTFHKKDHRNYNQNGEYFHIGETLNGIPLKTGINLVSELNKHLMEKTNLSLRELSIRWLLDHPEISTVITGASKPHQIIENSKVTDLKPLTKDVLSILHDFYFNDVRKHIKGGI